MARVVKTIKLSKLDTLPGTSLCAADMDCDGAMIIVRDDNTMRVVVWVINADGKQSIHYSYKIDAQGNYILGSARYDAQKLDEFLRSIAASGRKRAQDADDDDEMSV
ncbi:MAG TPA: hypothetical protein VKQ72_06195 [Aggregatilineales bacterium]|nr:hypothetical protein [Aggregatilineales bacterium]